MKSQNAVRFYESILTYLTTYKHINDTFLNVLTMTGIAVTVLQLNNKV